MKIKKYNILFLFGFILLLTTVIVYIRTINSPEKKTMRYFEMNKELFQESVLNYETTGQISSISGIKAIYWNGEHPIIEYTVATGGFGSASQYYGVFYSFDDIPVAFQNAKDMLIPISDNAWEWKGHGDNKGIVRKIESNWFYFEASF